MKNIVLLGGSNSIIKGLSSGLKQRNIHLINLALGGSTCLQNLYAIKRKRNQEFIQNADLIISESNVNDAINYMNDKG